MHQENTKLFSIKVPNHRWNRWKNALFTVNYVNNRFFFFFAQDQNFPKFTIWTKKFVWPKQKNT
jgi:hypothetical protein